MTTAAGETSRVLGERLDALASALREAGVSPETAARLLATAASATLDAVALELLRAGGGPVRSRPEPVRLVGARDARPARAAA